MLHSLAIVVALSIPSAEPASKELFAKEDFYKEQKGKEEDFVGVLKYTAPPEGVVGIGRSNPYRLELEGKNGFREVYVGGKNDLLKDYDGKKVKITGKAVELEVVGRVHKEIWPARIELVAEKPKEPKPKVVGDPKPIAPPPPVPEKDESCEKPAEAPKVVASTPGRLTGAGNEIIIRSEEEFKKAGDDFLKTAATRFKVEKIDPAKQMIVIIGVGSRPTGGYSVEVTGTEVKDGTLIIKWKENKPTGIVTQAFTNPAVSVLLPKFEGKITFDPAIPSGKDLPKRGIDNLKKPDVIRD